MLHQNLCMVFSSDVAVHVYKSTLRPSQILVFEPCADKRFDDLSPL